jgi:AcrR family transcriptional regulator
MVDEQPRNAPRWSRRPEARRGEILDAATLVFGEMGFVRAALTDVAKRAGVSAGTVHRYFGSKEALFEELVRSKVEALAEIEAMMVEGGDSAAATLEAVLRALARLSADRPSACLGAVIRSEATSLPGAARIMVDEVGGRFGRLLRSVIDAGVRSGEFRPVDPDTVSQLIVPSLMGVIHEYHTVGKLLKRDRVPLDRQVDAWFDLVFRGLLADPRGRSSAPAAPARSMR